MRKADMSAIAAGMSTAAAIAAALSLVECLGGAMEMTKNPYPKILIDEALGVEVPDDRHKIWQEGYNAGREDEKREVVRDLDAIDTDARRVCDLVVEYHRALVSNQQNTI